MRKLWVSLLVLADPEHSMLISEGTEPSEGRVQHLCSLMGLASHLTGGHKVGDR